MGAHGIHRILMRPRPLAHHAVLRAHEDLEMHMRHPSRVPSRKNGHEFALAVRVRHLVAPAVRQSLRTHLRVPGVVPVSVAMPNVDPHVGHRFAVVRTDNAHPLTQPHPFPIFLDFLPEKEPVFRQIKRERTGRFAGNQDAIAAPRPHASDFAGLGSRGKWERCGKSQSGSDRLEKLTAFHRVQVKVRESVSRYAPHRLLRWLLLHFFRTNQAYSVYTTCTRTFRPGSAIPTFRNRERVGM